MKYTIALAAVLFATAAHAEGYVEARGGIAGGSGWTSETIGVALGYDADVGSNAFIGGEVTADTDFSFSTPVYGANLRLGAKTGESGKIFGTVGLARYEVAGFIWGPSYSFYYTGWKTDVTAGAGYQHKLSEKTYISLQYQRYFDNKANRGSVGVGFKF